MIPCDKLRRHWYDVGRERRVRSMQESNNLQVVRCEVQAAMCGTIGGAKYGKADELSSNSEALNKTSRKLGRWAHLACTGGN